MNIFIASVILEATEQYGVLMVKWCLAHIVTDSNLTAHSLCHFRTKDI